MEIVGNAARGDSFFQSAINKLGRFIPSQVLQHHRAGKNYRARIHFVLSCVLRRSAVGGLKDGMAGMIVYISAGSYSNTAHDSSKCVGDVITIEVKGSSNGVFIRTKQYLLQERIGDHILDDDFVARLLKYLPRSAVEVDSAEFSFSQFITPVAESALRKLHNVSFVHQCYAGFLVHNGVFNC